MKGLTDVPGILVGHATNTVGLTGCTVVLCVVDVRGSATGSCEIEALHSGSADPHVHAIVLSGGSAFGLEASYGVRLALERLGPVAEGNVGAGTGASVGKLAGITQICH
jgi:L-aminopeptidase/D-esterase-like protein